MAKKFTLVNKNLFILLIRNCVTSALDFLVHAQTNYVTPKRQTYRLLSFESVDKAEAFVFCKPSMTEEELIFSDISFSGYNSPYIWRSRFR